ncbi:hypothetical protein GCM10018790_68620 [Kitasatospora xanthocidica]|nr:hypothetical protein GCM10018790_68620 [Kitasatospora xanthocidica]
MSRWSAGRPPITGAHQPGVCAEVLGVGQWGALWSVTENTVQVWGTPKGRAGGATA